jgi:ABC-type polysaccharide/polyol phosphate transport system ATPase subunit
MTTNPNNGDTGVKRTIKPIVTFDIALKSETVDEQNIKLQVYNVKKKNKKWLATSGTPSYSDKVITVTSEPNERIL